MDTVLLERSPQLAALRGYADEARRGHGRLVLLSGEAGAGKTALLERLAEVLPAERWCRSACDGLFTPSPLGPLLDLAGDLGGTLLELVQSGAPRPQLFAALLEQLEDPERLTVLVLEDVHWADEASLDLLRFLARRLPYRRVLLLVSYRDDALALDHPLRVALGALAGQRTTRRIAVPPLSSTTVDELARDIRIDGGELYRLTSGNAFLITEVLAAGGGSVPASIRDAALARSATLSSSAREALEVAAVLGPRFAPSMLDEVTPGLQTGVDELVACGMVIGDGRDLRFRHEISRVAVQESIAPHRRPRLHAAVLEALLRAESTDDARLAFHADEAGDDRALGFAWSAGCRARDLGSHHEAAAQLDRALRHAGGAELRFRATIADALANELTLVDRWQQAVLARGAALELWREADDRVRLGDSLRRQSRALWRLCQGSAAETAAIEAHALLEPLGPSRELAWAIANLAFERSRSGSAEEAIRLAHRAQALADRIGSDDVVSDALNTEGITVRSLGLPWEGLMGRSLEVARAGDHEEPVARALANTYTMLCADLRDVELDAFYADAISYCDEHDISTFGICLVGERIGVLERRGRWDDVVEQARPLLERSASPVNRSKALCPLAKVRARRGEREVWPLLDEAMESALGLGEAEWLVPAGLARVEAHWLAGDDDRARAELARLERLLVGADQVQQGWTAIWSRRLGVPPAGPSRAMIEPFTTILAGDPIEAARVWSDLRSPYEAALALADSGMEEHLRSALDQLVALGASAAARRVRVAMREQGLRSIPAGARASTLANPGGLTARQQEVLALVCAGRTNEQIAHSLVISIKTVDHHVSALLAKLGVANRSLAAVEARKLGLVSELAESG